MSKNIGCDAANVGLDELADLLPERHFARALTDTRLGGGVGGRAGGFTGNSGPKPTTIFIRAVCISVPWKHPARTLGCVPFGVRITRR